MYYCGTMNAASNALRAAMEANGLKPVDVASRLDININTVYKVLNGGESSRLTLRALERIPGFAERYHAAA